MKKLALTFILVLGSVAVACSSSSDNTSSSSGATGDGGTTPAGNAVTVKNFAFAPATLTIKAGETVTWTWAGGSHTVTSGASCKGDMAYTSGLKSATGDTFTHTYPTAGTFEYFCEPHCAASAMKGTIIVQ